MNKETCEPDYHASHRVSSIHPKWSAQAEIEIQRLKKLLPAELIVDIQHVGSTAIPNILSKPIIDIQVAVKSLAAMKEIAVGALKTIDYIFWDENPDPTRLFFVKGMPPFGSQRTHHVHIVESTSKHWRSKLLFRDYLRKHPAVAKEYEKLKIKLQKRHQYDREKYTDAKSDFVNCVLKEATAS